MVSYGASRLGGEESKEEIGDDGDEKDERLRVEKHVRDRARRKLAEVCGGVGQRDELIKKMFQNCPPAVMAT